MICGAKGLDTIMVADNLINSIPWQKVFTRRDRSLKKQGLVMVCFGVNIPRGEAFHTSRPVCWAEVKDFFTQDLGYKILEYGTQKAVTALCSKRGGDDLTFFS